MRNMFLTLRRIMAWTCGMVVHGLWAAWGLTFRLTHSPFHVIKGWVQSYGFVDRLYQFSTQVLPIKNIISISVSGQFYPVSTPPIKTTTYLKNLLINLLPSTQLIAHERNLKGFVI